MSDRPWAEYSHGRAISTAKIARLLRPFGIVGGEYRIAAEGDKVLKGYRRDAFSDAWVRYLPSEARQRDKPNEYGPESPEIKARQNIACRPLESATNPMNTESCRVVALSKPDLAVLPMFSEEVEDGRRY